MSEQTLDQASASINIDSIEDMPGFDTPPSGTYACALSTMIKEINSKPVLSFAFTLQDTLALGTQNTEAPHLPGQKFDTLFNLDAKGLPWAKPYLQTLRAATGSSGDLAEIVGNSQGLNVVASFNYRSYVNKDGEAKQQFQLKTLKMA